MFTNQDIAEYYDTTQNHYIRWWGLRRHLSLHFGIWDDQTTSFKQALENTNRLMSEKCHINANDSVLDAGCGVGGAALYLAATFGSKVHGITLSQKQADFATSESLARNLADKLSFSVSDFCKTPFPDQSFDVVWACESVSHAPDKSEFIREAYRLLKPGGRLILADFFAASTEQRDKRSLVQKWINAWGISSLTPAKQFAMLLATHGFKVQKVQDYTNQIIKTSRKLYLASLFGSIGSECYNLLYPGVSRFAKRHYRSGIYQYKALKAELWTYHMILAIKPG